MFRLSNKKALSQGLRCKIQLLVPGEEIEVSYNTTSTGQDILNDVANQIDLLDKDYYGLKLYDHIEWLDLTKSLYKQTKGIQDVILLLRFKYYPAEPALLANESTRYYLYLQLRADLLEGRLKGETPDTLAYLIACVLQSELGDAAISPEIGRNRENYVSDFKFVPNQSEDLEWASIRLHQSEDFLGLRSADAELNFLKKASQLDTYGVDPYPVKEGGSHKHFLIGVNHRGITTFQDSRMTNLFTWNEIERITVDNKLVVIYCRKIERKNEKNVKKRSLFAFRCPSQEHAHNFWKISTEHKYFFTLDTTPELPIVKNTGGFFKKSHKLKYVGRVEKDLLRDHVDEARSCGVKRSRSLMAKTNDGPLWQGFQPGLTNSNSAHLPTSVNNINSLDSMNKTFPTNMNYFREEEEEEQDEGKLIDGSRKDGKRGSGLFEPTKEEVSKTAGFQRRSVLTTKTDELAAGNAIRRGSQIYMDTEQKNNDFFRASLILFVITSAIFFTILLMSDSDRPSSISLLVKRLNLDSASVTLRQEYYLPMKSALTQTFGHIYSVLDAKII